MMLNYFYVTYDMTPFTEQNKDYIQVGIAPANTVNLIGASEYNHTGPSNVPGDQSSSTGTVVPGETPVPTNGNTPIVIGGGKFAEIKTWIKE
jgi:flagellar motor protein MotB